MISKWENDGHMNKVFYCYSLWLERENNGKNMIAMNCQFLS